VEFSIFSLGLSEVDMLPVRVLIAENNRLSYVGIDHLLRDDPTIRVVGHVTDWVQLMTQLDTIEHDVLLLSQGILPLEPFTALRAFRSNAMKFGC
jgi:DNA-binding NarL/FixJ family response regulator